MKWEINVKYPDNPAGPTRGKVIVDQDDPPEYGSWGFGAFGRYWVKSKRPRKIGPKPILKIAA